MMLSWKAGLSEAIQFIFNVGAVFFNLIFINMLRREYFHLNMRIILALNALSLIVAQLSALLSDNIIDHLPYDMANAKSFIDVMRDTALNVNTFMVVPLVGERIVASFSSRRYETLGRPWYMFYALSFVSLSWILNALAAFYTEDILRNFDLTGHLAKLRPEAEGNKYWLVLYYGAGGAVNIISVLIFIGLYKYNQYRYERGMDLNHHSLSLRYQLAENVRTGKQLMPVAFLTSVTQTFYGFVLTGAVWSAFTSEFMEAMLLIIPPTCAVTATLTPLVHIWFHDTMRRSILSSLQIEHSHTSHCQVEGLDGKNLIVEKNDTPAVHFQMLTKSWL
ncbi:unnamed protein product [Bursaphelenchus xylophilus]|uniref:(pine wood nematode) hypothetical protein n=1 Tax=Bursaphelenchus xylophilus TaxID=6326 RepID=A0A1I7S5H5_BURXY|nr:unnamed protein product [Bursaphelenchus xylophilus]CAG9124715.1 unnamed protein product [Bursaphelenchus xylophilus]